MKYAPKNSKQRRNLLILNIHFQSARNKGRNIDVLIETSKPDIILCTETWLIDEIESIYFFIPSIRFNAHRRNRPSDPQ